MLDLRAVVRGDEEEVTKVRPVRRTAPPADTSPDFVNPWTLPVWRETPFDASVPLKLAEPTRPPLNVFLRPPGIGDPPSPFASTPPKPATAPAARKKERRTSRLLLLALFVTFAGFALLVWDDPVLRADVRARAIAAYALVR
jgi:hypothetical protein